jgi:hypothetical protein
MNKIPTFHTGTRTVIESPEELAVYLIRHSLFNPGGISEYIEDKLVSLRCLMAEYGDRIHEMSDEYSVRMSNIISKAVGFRVSVETKIVPLSENTNRVYNTRSNIENLNINIPKGEITNGKMSLIISVINSNTGEYLINESIVNCSGSNIELITK